MSFFEYFAPKLSNLDFTVIFYILIIAGAIWVFRKIAGFTIRVGAVVIIAFMVITFATDLIGLDFQSFSDYVTGNIDNAIDNTIKKW